MIYEGPKIPGGREEVPERYYHDNRAGGFAPDRRVAQRRKGERRWLLADRRNPHHLPSRMDRLEADRRSGSDRRKA